MRYIHQRCLGRWQHALRRQKGSEAARVCDICSAPWTVQCPPSYPNDDGPNEDGHRLGNGRGRIKFFIDTFISVHTFIVLAPVSFEKVVDFPAAIFTSSFIFTCVVAILGIVDHRRAILMSLYMAENAVVGLGRLIVRGCRGITRNVYGVWERIVRLHGADV